MQEKVAVIERDLSGAPASEFVVQGKNLAHGGVSIRLEFPEWAVLEGSLERLQLFELRHFAAIQRE